ncbi:MULTISPECIES: hypothetical protein [Caldimonas]|jgi:hypothetical protein|uniref:hypothetical protein n=1 Tax=Caldimonas TaxID=196013 RepID=UPI0003756139|nr:MULTISPECIES: hypothetical protein [Caldimonas]MCX7659438.1 hypothetical protein [Caldimonas manganoxidans]GIX23786.1 MAG: hypothetical protein KatS3mg122_1017 [Caldimonas sp.]
MKEYKLSGWPELPPAYQRTAYQRMLHQMSQGFVPLSLLVRASGLGRDAVQHFLAQLDTRGVLVERTQPRPPLGAGMASRSLAWLRRALRV